MDPGREVGTMTCVSQGPDGSQSWNLYLGGSTELRKRLSWRAGLSKARDAVCNLVVLSWQARDRVNPIASNAAQE